MKNLSLLLFVCIGYQSYAMQAPLDVNKNIYFEQTYGWSSRQGPRPTMEDAHAALYPFGAKKEWGFYAIFDGHGGEETAEFAATHLPQYVLKALASNPMVSRTFLLGGEFTRIDRALERENVDDGATALVALVENNLLRLAWAGDSRAIVIRGNAIVAQTKDHKPNDQNEKQRIEKAGGAVFMGRVNGRLAVARALGDFDIKRQTPGGLISTPDFERVILENNDILVLACDGLWDVFSNEAVKNRLNELLAQNIESLRKQYPHEKPADEIFAQEGANDEKMKLIARALRDDALQKGSRDNVSVMVVQFHQRNVAGQQVQPAVIPQIPVAGAIPVQMPAPGQQAPISFVETFGASALLGSKHNVMEDSWVALYPFGNISNAFYAIYDGHNGPSSQTIAQRLHEIFRADLQRAGPQDSRATLFTKAFHEMDRLLEQQGIPGGSTAIVGFVEGNLLRLVWAGDSRAIVLRNGRVIEQTNDHTPRSAQERARIEGAIGLNNYIMMSNSNLSRGLGDFGAKREYRGGFIATPELKRLEIYDNDILMMASDGLWDKMSSEEVGQLIQKMLSENIETLRKQHPQEKPAGVLFAQEIGGNEQLKLIARGLRDIARQRGSIDDISVIIVQFKKPSSAQLPLPPIPQRPQAPVPAPQPAAQPVVQPPVYQVPVLAPQPQQIVHEIAFTNVTGETPLYVKVIGNNGALLMDQYIYPNQWTSRISIPSYGWPVTVSIRSGSGALSFDTGLTPELLAQRLRESRIVIPADFRGNILTNIYLYRDTFKASAELRPY